MTMRAGRWKFFQRVGMQLLPSLGGEKMRQGAGKYSRLYFLALALAGDHCRPVRHFRMDKEYTCIIQGIPYAKSSKRKVAEFDFAALADMPEEPLHIDDGDANDNYTASNYIDDSI